MAPVTVAPISFIESLAPALNVAVAVLTAIAATGAALASQHGFALSLEAAPPDVMPGAYLGSKDLYCSWLEQSGMRKELAARARATQSVSSSLAFAAALFGVGLALPLQGLTLCLGIIGVVFSATFIVQAAKKARCAVELAQASTVYEIWLQTATPKNNRVDSGARREAFKDAHPREASVLNRAKVPPFDADSP